MNPANSDVVVFSRDDLDLLVAFAGCTLNESPGTNWVEEAGSLPEYICRIARAVKRTGKTTSQAIAIAVSRVKKWAAGADDVDADTRAKAATAVAQWEALKAKNKTKKGVKKVSKTVAASHTEPPVLCLAAADYNINIVTSAFEARQREVRKQWRAANPTGAYDDFPPQLYVREHWTKFLIVSSGYGEDRKLFKVPYTVGKDLTVTFGDAVEVKNHYVVVKTDEAPGGDLSDGDIKKMMDLTAARPGALARVLALTKTS